MNEIFLSSIQEVLDLQVDDTWEKCVVKLAPDNEDPGFLRDRSRIVFYEKGKTMLWAWLNRLPGEDEAAILAFVEEQGFPHVESAPRKGGWTQHLYSKVEVAPKPIPPEMRPLGSYQDIRNLRLEAAWNRCQVELEHSTRGGWVGNSILFLEDDRKVLLLQLGPAPDEARDHIFEFLTENGFQMVKRRFIQAVEITEFTRG